MVTAIIILLTLLAVVGLMVGWHLFFPVIGGAIVITTGIWFFILVAIVFFGAAIMLLVTMLRISIYLLSFPLILLTIIGVIFFPVLTPVLVPLLMIFIAAAIIRNANKAKQK